jgi:anti-anti-sigma factor
LTNALIAAVIEGPYPVRWTGRQAVVTLPEHIDVSNSGQIREQLLELVNRGAAVLIADMTGTVSSDHGGADALLRAYQRASISGTQLRVAVTAQIVRRVLDVSGLDRLVSIYPSLEAAVAAGIPDVIPLVPKPGAGQPSSRHAEQAAHRRAALTRDRSLAARITPAMLWRLVDALNDGVLLTDDDGLLVLANRRAEDMFGYRHGELIGHPVESLVPAGLRAAHITHRARYAQESAARPMGSRARLVGLRKDGSTFPVRVSLSPVPTATSRFILAVIRDITDDHPHADLADLARAAAAAEQAHRGRELLGRVANNLLHVGLSLQTAIDLPQDVAGQRIADALQSLDNTIREIHDHIFAERDHDDPPDPAPPDQTE